jgi:hypothetical protein
MVISFPDGNYLIFVQPVPVSSWRRGGPTTACSFLAEKWFFPLSALFNPILVPGSNPFIIIVY